MLSIDEAIAQYKEKSNFYKQTTNIAYGLELEQLAEWLEELKAIKDGSIPIIHGKAELELHDKEVYNKAIDDAKSVILQTLDNEIMVDILHLMLEQLKGKYNE